jgi:hypothetical protein
VPVSSFERRSEAHRAAQGGLGHDRYWDGPAAPSAYRDNRERQKRTSEISRDCQHAVNGNASGALAVAIDAAPFELVGIPEEGTGTLISPQRFPR